MIVALSGCYTFRPADAGDLSPGETVRVRVAGGYADSLSVLLQRPDGRLLEGSVVERDASAMLLEVQVSSELQGMRFEALNQRVEIPTTEVVEVELKELDKGKTYGVAALAAVAIAGIVVRQLNADGGGAQRPGTGGPQDAVVTSPGFQMPVGWLGRILGIH
ncbi:MAG: hypothetical protein AAF389_20700 [Gemmatimonadota bacterium]